MLTGLYLGHRRRYHSKALGGGVGNRPIEGVKDCENDMRETKVAVGKLCTGQKSPTPTSEHHGRADIASWISERFEGRDDVGSCMHTKGPDEQQRGIALRWHVGSNTACDAQRVSLEQKRRTRIVQCSAARHHARRVVDRASGVSAGKESQKKTNHQVLPWPKSSQTRRPTCSSTSGLRAPDAWARPMKPGPVDQEQKCFGSARGSSRDASCSDKSFDRLTWLVAVQSKTPGNSPQDG
ncbi:predicted protein [Verticillium alfalfae VaMs.102]|uniref:Predicted protein n=1 Tax=Verticillium alfalfae (strain VaMs.102 / ATCC MYA-4576 / FGSC 10136) TaxID=526221 RepID=C9SV82_VERA1|nr:predicted protein [Verticillium alfalfae VaMs.102]EEY22697.1 predicted protein [Verticillium alfalfae VaMs.102]